MKKTISVSLAGYSYTIEENAYLKLSNYLDALKKPLSEEEIDEVVHDIELRMVEILNERLKNRNVINNQDVDSLISQIGTPEEIEDFQGYENTNSTNKNTEKQDKQLFRDIERKKIAGVCGGLSYYFGIDIVIVRILFLILFLGTGFGFLLYLILWIVVPKAEKTGDILKMKGKPVTFENIKEYSSQMAKEAYDSANSLYTENKSKIVTVGQFIIRVFSIIIGVISSFLAFCLLVVSFAFLFGKISLGSSSHYIPENIRFYLGDTGFSTAIITFGFISLFFSSLYFLFLAVRCFYSPLKSIFLKITFLIALSGWIVLSILVLVGISKIDSQYEGKNKFIETKSFTVTTDTLFLKIKEVSIPTNFNFYLGNIYSNKREIIKETEPSLSIVKNDSLKTPYLQMEISGDGEHLPLDINLPIEIQNNQIYFPDKYLFSYTNRWRNYNIKYTLYVSNATTIINQGRIKTVETAKYFTD